MFTEERLAIRDTPKVVRLIGVENREKNVELKSWETRKVAVWEVLKAFSSITIPINLFSLERWVEQRANL